MTINASKTVRELAIELPSATRVFERLGIDYCCGGGRSLDDACVHAGVEVDSLVRSLEEAEAATENSEFKDWQTAPLSELTAYIVSKHHLFTREESERIDALLDKVCSVHGQNYPELLRIKELFHELKLELTTHMQKEEAVLFPYVDQMEDAIKNGKLLPAPFFATVRNPVRMMMTEHDSAGEILRSLRSLSSDFTAPEQACISYRSLYQALEGFEQDLHRHIHLENNLLFPRAVELERVFNLRLKAS